MLSLNIRIILSFNLLFSFICILQQRLIQFTFLFELIFHFNELILFSNIIYFLCFKMFVNFMFIDKVYLLGLTRLLYNIFIYF